MPDTFGPTLRALRLASGYQSLGAFAAAVNYSKSHICNVEGGNRRPTVEFAIACDAALGTEPNLENLARDPHGDDVNRRKLLASIAGVGAAALTGPPSLADSIRHSLLSVTAGTDFDALVAHYSQRLVTDSSPAFGDRLQAELLGLHRRLFKHPEDKDLLRASAHLAQTYGLYRGDVGDLPDARHWYRAAATLADRSRCTDTRAYVRGRTVARASYEGHTIAQTLTRAHQVLALSTRPTAGALEAHAARVHAHALAGDLTAGRAAINDMREVAEHLDAGAGPVGPAERLASFTSYLECRAGNLADAQRAFGEADAALRDVPLWRADARIYFGRAQVRHGDVAAGLAEAKAAIATLPHPVRVLKIGVKDVVSAVPATYSGGDDLAELRAYAAGVRGPWEEEAAT